MVVNDNYFAKIKRLLMDESVHSYTISVTFIDEPGDTYCAFNGPDSNLCWQIKTLERKIDLEASLKN